MGKTSFVSIMLWKAFIVASLVVFKERSKYLSQTSISASVHYEVDWGVERVRIPDILWMHSKPRNIILVTADWAGVTMTRQWSAGVVQSCCNHYQWSNVMWWENSFSIPSICYTDHSHCIEVFTWTLSDEVVSSSCRYEWEAERSWSRSCVCAVLWIVLILSIDTRHASDIWLFLMILYKITSTFCYRHFHTLTIC